MRGYPVGTIAFYGPDDQRASKVAVSVIPVEGAEPILHRWFSETGERTDETILVEIAAHASAFGAVGSDGGSDHRLSSRRRDSRAVLFPMPVLEGKRPVDRGIGSGLMGLGEERKVPLPLASHSAHRFVSARVILRLGSLAFM